MTGPAKSKTFATRGAVEAWAKYWRDVHVYLADLPETSKVVAECTFVLRYEKLCNRPKGTLARLCSHVGLSPDVALLEEQQKRLHLPSYYIPDFYKSDPETIHAKSPLKP
jgi:hypothetical protein